MSPQCLRKGTKFLNVASTRKYCPFYSQLFLMYNIALCQIDHMLHNLLIVLIVLVLSMTGGVTPMLWTWTSQRRLIWSTIQSLLKLKFASIGGKLFAWLTLVFLRGVVTTPKRFVSDCTKTRNKVTPGI